MSKFNIDGGYKDVTPPRETQGAVASPEKAVITPEFRQATREVLQELNCSRGIAPADEARMKDKLRDVMADMTKADTSPLYSSKANLNAAVDNVFNGLAEKSNSYVKAATPEGFFAGDRKEEFAKSKAAECTPVLDKRELERHGMDR